MKRQCQADQCQLKQNQNELRGRGIHLIPQGHESVRPPFRKNSSPANSVNDELNALPFCSGLLAVSSYSPTSKFITCCKITLGKRDLRPKVYWNLSPRYASLLASAACSYLSSKLHGPVTRYPIDLTQVQQYLAGASGTPSLEALNKLFGALEVSSHWLPSAESKRYVALRKSCCRFTSSQSQSSSNLPTWCQNYLWNCIW